jgi:hypothetical protein
MVQALQILQISSASADVINLTLFFSIFLIFALTFTPIISILTAKYRLNRLKFIFFLPIMLGLFSITTFMLFWVFGFFAISGLYNIWKFFIYFAGCVNIILGIGIISYKDQKIGSPRGWMLTTTGIISITTYAIFWLLGLIEPKFTDFGKTFIISFSILTLTCGIILLLFDYIKNK